MGGDLKSSRLSMDELSNNNVTGIELFVLTISVKRPKYLLQHVRLDDLDSREEANR